MSPSLVVDSRTLTDWVMEQQGEDPTPWPMPGVGWLRDGALCAALVFERFTGRNGDVSVHAAALGDMPRGWLLAVGRMLFGHLGVARVSMPIKADNTRCIALAQRLGATLDYVIRQGHSGGDVHVYCLWRNTGIHRRMLVTGKLKE